MTRLILSLVLLTLIYALTLASLDPWDLLVGAFVSAALLELFRRAVIGRRPAPLHDLPARLVAFFPFAARIVRDVLVGTWQVALVVLRLRPLGHPGIVAIPIEGRSHRGIAVTALVTTLSPGSFFIGVDWERGVMLFHFFDAGDPDAIRRDLEWFYHRYQRRVFP
ncbi:MAG: Na+/H+ antiporter subunit E [Chloroflexota bacterium]|nr:Na+/H+ antiporter subunit E [Chloroflexota bacterium]